MPDIRDPNLRLTILHAAWAIGLLPPFDKKAFYSDVVCESWDPEADYNDAIDERVRKHVVAIPLPATLLAQLTWISWDAGNEVFNDVWTSFDGESDAFAVHDLTGIQACQNLEVLEFTAGAAFRDCAPLAGLPKLRSVMLLGGWIGDLKPLLTLPSLKKLEAVLEDTRANQVVLDTLRAKGVSVTTYDE